MTKIPAVGQPRVVMLLVCPQGVTAFITLSQNADNRFNAFGLLEYLLELYGD